MPPSRAKKSTRRDCGCDRFCVPKGLLEVSYKTYLQHRRRNEQIAGIGDLVNSTIVGLDGMEVDEEEEGDEEWQIDNKRWKETTLAIQKAEIEENEAYELERNVARVLRRVGKLERLLKREGLGAIGELFQGESIREKMHEGGLGVSGYDSPPTRSPTASTSRDPRLAYSVDAPGSTSHASGSAIATLHNDYSYPPPSPSSSTYSESAESSDGAWRPPPPSAATKSLPKLERSEKAYALKILLDDLNRRNYTALEELQKARKRMEMTFYDSVSSKEPIVTESDLERARVKDKKPFVGKSALDGLGEVKSKKDAPAEKAKGRAAPRVKKPSAIPTSAAAIKSELVRPKPEQASLLNFFSAPTNRPSVASTSKLVSPAIVKKVDCESIVIPSSPGLEESDGSLSSLEDEDELEFMELDQAIVEESNEKVVERQVDEESENQKQKEEPVSMIIEARKTCLGGGESHG